MAGMGSSNGRATGAFQVANADDEEKDIWPADLNKDGWMDVIVVRKEPFSAATEPPSRPPADECGRCLGRHDGCCSSSCPTQVLREHLRGGCRRDWWEDVVIVNTFNQHALNKGEDASGNWLGLEDDSQARLPQLVSDQPLICAVWAGDLTGNGAQDLYYVNYRVNSGGGTAKDFLLINDGTGHFTDQGALRAGDLLNSAFGTAGQIHDMDGDGDLDIVKNTTLYNVFPWNSRGSFALQRWVWKFSHVAKSCAHRLAVHV